MIIRVDIPINVLSVCILGFVSVSWFSDPEYSVIVTLSLALSEITEHYTRIHRLSEPQNPKK